MIKRVKGFLKGFLLNKKSKNEAFEGDSLEYEILDHAVKRLEKPIGTSVEMGVRRGKGSKTIIDAYRKYHPNLIGHVHLGIDPYGDLVYNFSENDKGRKADYTNSMKRDTMLGFYRYYPEFNLVNLEDKEFFLKFADGYPIYNNEKRIINSYEIVHFDGPHDFKSVMNEVDFFVKRIADHSIYIFDDIEAFDIGQVEKLLSQKNFKKLEKGKRKISFEFKKKKLII